jgi:hypothetical protein
MLDALQRELVGPDPRGSELDCSVPLVFQDPKDAYRPYREKGTGEEILSHGDNPSTRYGTGVLYPRGTAAADLASTVAAGAIEQGTSEDGAGSGDQVRRVEPLTEQAARSIEAIEKRADAGQGGDDPYDFDITTANSLRPSSMGVSFLVEFAEDAVLRVEAHGGRYRELQVQVADKEGKRRERRWWLRGPIKLSTEFRASDLCAPRTLRVSPSATGIENTEDLDLRIEVFSRPHNGSLRQRLVTVCLVNHKDTRVGTDKHCLFQAGFTVSVHSPLGLFNILPYPGPPHEKLDEEEASLALLYRDADTFAVGHGCAAGWDRTVEGRRASFVTAENLPSFETPSTTPDIRRADGTPIEVSMAALGGLVKGTDGFDDLEEVVSLYADWIRAKRAQIASVEERYRPAAQRHMDECTECLQRMQAGLSYLRSDVVALTAFRLANQAILLQQIHSRREPRAAVFDEKVQRLIFPEPYREPDPISPAHDRGKWRAFQIAFLLMSVRSTVDGRAPDRSTVELIWFPTGGGKTEAYLGLAAFALFVRRLKDPQDDGVHVLMRYTLRLLTAQQFQRASGLICAMEHLRKTNPNLGSTPFSIGIWVGSATTPNIRADAILMLNGLIKGDRYTENGFILSRCPWCGAQMGVFEQKEKGKASKYAPKVLGYARQADTVVFKCPDNSCEFSSGIPVYAIDEDIYARRPSLVIGTVDKFAMLAWRPAARSLFGIGPDGERVCSPPGLIIQDELHLIAGPLGSVVGLYETVIEELCTDRRGNDGPVSPKIVSSTATIRRYRDQIRALYARTDVALFPPPGLDAGDSFFARYARKEDGTLANGRFYVGVYAPGLGSLQTVQVRTYSGLLQGPVGLSDAERDPWWTLLLFFGALRELGNALSLFQSDIPDYMRAIADRTATGAEGMRSFWELRELTGRLRSDEVPEAISALEVSCTSKSERRPVDVCLASSILEVGIDIDRLSLMVVVGQPKTTSQYIQVTGRVGRRWWERPGLVTTIYKTTSPRDRSHFEKFRSYHERLYAQVEPTSVTPFSPPALDRVLHAAMVMYVRQSAGINATQSPYPCPREILEALKEIMLRRVQAVDPAESANFEKVFDRRLSEWEKWEPTRWEASWQDSETPLIRPAGEYADAVRKQLSWATPTSMRNVDAECMAQVTQLYVMEGNREEKGER